MPQQNYLSHWTGGAAFEAGIAAASAEAERRNQAELEEQRERAQIAGEQRRSQLQLQNEMAITAFRSQLEAQKTYALAHDPETWRIGKYDANEKIWGDQATQTENYNRAILAKGGANLTRDYIQKLTDQNARIAQGRQTLVNSRPVLTAPFNLSYIPATELPQPEELTPEAQKAVVDKEKLSGLQVANAKASLQNKYEYGQKLKQQIANDTRGVRGKIIDNASGLADAWSQTNPQPISIDAVVEGARTAMGNSLSGEKKDYLRRKLAEAQWSNVSPTASQRSSLSDYLASQGIGNANALIPAQTSKQYAASLSLSTKFGTAASHALNAITSGLSKSGLEYIRMLQQKHPNWATPQGWLDMQATIGADAPAYPPAAEVQSQIGLGGATPSSAPTEPPPTDDALDPSDIQTGGTP